MRIMQAIKIIKLYLKTLNNRNIELLDSVYKYSVSSDTAIRIGAHGTVSMGYISTETNVHLTVWGGKLRIGNHCSFNRNDIIVCRDSISIGDGTIFGPNVCIYDHDHLFGADGKVDGEYNCSPISIGSNVWIGAGVIILRGSTIGDNCVVGAGSIISGFIPPNSLVTNQRDVSIVSLYNNEKKRR